MTLHEARGSVIEFIDDDHATGRVVGFSEQANAQHTVITSFRYYDEYARLDITVETGSPLGGPTRWAGRRHDDDRPDASSGSSSAELFNAVFHALHDGEQVALGFDCPLTLPVLADQDTAAPAPADGHALVRQAGRA